MKLNSKLTWGLAWAGLAVVLAVPSADFLAGRMGGAPTAAVLSSTTDPVLPVVGKSGVTTPAKTATVTTKLTKNGVTIIPAGTPTVAATPTNDPVTKLLRSGKALPDYISGGTNAPTSPQVAAVDPAATVVPPVPFPSWARPHDVAKPVAPADAEAPVIVDDPAIDPVETATVDVNSGPIPPAPVGSVDPKTGRLDQYLKSQGLLNDSTSGRSSASVTVVDRPSRNYDADGFYLNEGPNNSNARRAARRARVEQMFGDDDSDTSNDDGSFSFDLF